MMQVLQVLKSIKEKGFCKNVSCETYKKLCDQGLRNSLDLHYMEGSNTLYSESFYYNMMPTPAEMKRLLNGEAI